MNTSPATVNNQTGTFLNFTSTVDKYLDLFGISTSRWIIASNVGTVTVTS